MPLSPNDPDYAEIMQKIKQQAKDEYKQNPSLFRAYGDGLKIVKTNLQKTGE